MGNLFNICYAREKKYDADVTVIYAPYCSECNGRILKQITLMDGKYMTFYCSEQCKSKYLRGNQPKQYNAQAKDPASLLSSPFARHVQ